MSADVLNNSIPAPRQLLAIRTLMQREIVRFCRQRSRLIGALAQPVLFWILFGSGFRGSFQAEAFGEMSYQEYFFPGIAVLILMFTAIFSSISIIEDRHEGFLQGVLVSPVSRSSLVLGKLFGGTLLALMQAMLFLGLGWILAAIGLAPSMSTSFGFGEGVLLFLFMGLVAFGLAALGFMIAWRFDSVQGFHAIMSVFLMPMWLVSGAFFPAGENGMLAWVIRLNPLTYGVAGIRRLLYAGSESLNESTSTLPELWLCVVVAAVFAALCLTISIWLTGTTPRLQTLKKKRR
jgi:ABC-2 type transport system permease protein